MRKITQQMADAFNTGKTLTVGNTFTDGKAVYLHGNKILSREPDGIYWNLCGWNTPTTRERLSPWIKVVCKNRAPYVGGVLIENYSQPRKI